jgi:transcriptional regulator with GAF, ATPase, and Fis domain
VNASADFDRTTETVEIPRPPDRGPWLLEIASPEASEVVRLDEGRELVLGSGPGADLRLADPAVSARHCAVRSGDGGVEVSDLGSKNGVRLGAARLASLLLCGEGTSFVIGQTSVTIRKQGDDDDGDDAPAIPNLVGRSIAMQRVRREIARHARTRAAVLIQGESGSGKDVVAQALHALSGRSGAYVPLNAGAFPDSLADAELFGHRRGAYTGAVSGRAGAFELAHRGTLFLDEVGELSHAVQVKLLRVVEDGAVRPIGASDSLRVDVRLVAASWARLDERVREGSFRADLFHRLSTVTIELPPLRRRKSDIPALSRVLLSRLKDDVGERRLTGAALARLLEYAWPGNVRELSAVLYRSAVTAPDIDIDAHHVVLPEDPRALTAKARAAPERALELLRAYGGNVSAASRAAGVPRSTFRAWLARCEKDAQNRPNTASPPDAGVAHGTTATSGTAEAPLAVSPVLGAVVK